MLRFNWCQTNLISLRVVEYTGPESFGNLYSVKSVPVLVRFFELASSQPEVNSHFPGAEVYYMPNKKFTSTWDELVFDASYKDDFLTMAINTERLNRTSNKFTMLEDRIILLHGPPGTGKTSLCQGLAQKVSIRLCTVYQKKQLVEIGAATLLSKFFSESAKIVDQIFRSLADRCEKNPDSFYFVLIDEVESLAMSRESNHQRGEPQDSLRATNAFLTGLDRLKPYPNILVMCTSNLKDSIDTAFLSRCGCNAIEVGLPSVRLQYDILKGQLQSLIEQNIIAHDTNVLPSIELAKQQTIGGSETDGARLIRLLNVIQENMEPPSARFLRQLPIKSISRYLKRKDCNLRMAFGYMERIISSMGSVLSDKNAFIEDLDGRCGTKTPDPDESKKTITIFSNTRKRTWQIFVDGELCQDDRKKIISLLNN
ncbi:hypothetical protein HYALB_00008916 [Hymenoscyphus albidus]|uniref:AAA+ ATPase domain-containing protein n=1 Tax=Hymenoscyphus albidus TaxID=595503 RepID=A0A9N9QAM5_9HELO|nr:hypothetical protein HYALB_00008916 [Hymenoscyphus albidus]